MKNKLFILSLLAALVLASCGPTSYYSSVYNDSIYNRPTRAHVTVVKSRDAAGNEVIGHYSADVYAPEAVF